MIVVQIIVFLLGLLIAMSTLFSAIKETVLPGRKKCASRVLCFGILFACVEW
jgi:hypothetical protein